MSERVLPRHEFNEHCLKRDSHQCIVPWCTRSADEVHHIIDRSEWAHSGNIVQNGVSICNSHHQAAEESAIPAQAFWLWLDIVSPCTPENADMYIDKWGNEISSPRYKEERDRIKYQSTRHAMELYWNESDKLAKNRLDSDDGELHSLDPFVGKPLVITEKVDGGNCCLVSPNLDQYEHPVRARNGTTPADGMELLYEKGGLYWRQQVNQKLPERLMVFGEFVYYKHNIHYGCDCETPCDHIGPSLSEMTGVDDDRAYFQVFGVYDTVLDMWLSWPRTQALADELGFPTTPVIYAEGDADKATYSSKREAITDLLDKAHNVVENGGEGIVVRTKYPFTYADFGTSLAKYVREQHVTDSDKHWKKRKKKQNIV